MQRMVALSVTGTHSGLDGASSDMMAPESRTSIVETNGCVSRDNKPSDSSSSVSSISSASSSSGNVLSALSKTEQDRLIAENMASVLKIMKKRKHAKKHARHRQAAAAESTSNREAGVQKVKSCDEDQKLPVVQEKIEPARVPRRTSPRKAKHTIKEQGASGPHLPKGAKNGLKEVQPTSNDDSVPSQSAAPTIASDKNGKENKTVNAFQIMMGARNKSIGSNSPGKDRAVDAPSTVDVSLERQEKSKRTLHLQEWAARKGGDKRKRHEEAEEEYIEHQLNKQAKRMKNLLNNMEDKSTPEREGASGNRLAGKRRRVTASLTKTQSKTDVTERTVEVCTTPNEPTESKQTVVEIEDSLDDEFLKQLSSPRKKKDSLLGYFSKMPTPEDSKKNPTPQNGSQTTPELGEAVVEADAKTITPVPSGRPRRSCANRIKDYAIFERISPTKKEKKDSDKDCPTVTPLKIINVQSPSTMKVVRSPSLRMFSSTEVATASTPVSSKLAPVFVKATAKPTSQPAIDPERLRARQLFLMSGLPEKMRQEIDRRTVYVEYILNESPVFPLVSHVTQLDFSVSSSSGEDLGRSRIRLRKPEGESPIAQRTLKTIMSRRVSYGMFTSCSQDDYEDAMERCIEEEDPERTLDGEVLPEVNNLRDVVRSYKQRYLEFPVFDCYKQFRAVYENYEKVFGGVGSQSEEEQVTNDAPQSHDESVEIVETPHGCRNGELLFTEKYKPQTTEEILVNFIPAAALKRFLALWQDESGAGRRVAGTAPVNGDCFASGDDLSCDNEQSNGSTSSAAPTGGGPCNYVVLVGPPGCGKTSNVYAVANEMNFNVLEINASSRRKGKLILQELLEATQSHQVRQKTALAEKQSTPEGSVVKGKVLRELHQCLERRQSSTDSAVGGESAKKLSLILIEDVDIVFDQDDGFLGAINQLIATSKRPIVLTTSDPSCPHMARYMARSNVIRYVAPGIEHVSKFLSLLSLVERIPIDKHDIGRLYAYNRKDMRKTLNELQFFVQSGGDRSDDDEAPTGSGKDIHHSSLYRSFTGNQNEEMVLPSPLDFDALWCNMELVLRKARVTLAKPATNGEKGGPKKPLSSSKRQRLNGTKRTIDNAIETPRDELAFLYDNVSRAEANWGVMRRNRERYGRCVEDEQYQQQMTTELNHDLIEGSWTHWFERSKANDAPTGDGNSGGAYVYNELRRMEPEERRTISSHIGIGGTRNRVTSCDYEPYLRQICRYERDRSSQKRRGTRFYHYLRNFSSTSTATNGFSVNHVDDLSHRFEGTQPEKGEDDAQDTHNEAFVE